MASLELIASVAAANRDDIVATLAAAKDAAAQARSVVSEHERTVAAMQFLLDLIEPSRTDDDGSGAMTLHSAMEAVLREKAPSGLRGLELAAQINAAGLYRMRDGSPVGVAQIHARAGNYPQLFVKRDGRIALRDENPS